MIIPVGISDFRDIRENGYYYVDKSKMIKELLADVGTKVTLITRPRRFGKTLNMSMLAGIFSGAGYDVESNREHGEGRSDVIVKDYLNDRVAIFEVKHSEKLGDLEADCMRALTQIREKGYAEEFKEDYTEILCYGVACCKKRCLIRSL